MSISAPGIYDIPHDAYHADPCPEPSLSAGAGKMLVTHSPMHVKARHPKLCREPLTEHKDAFDFGRAVHSAVLYQNERIEVWPGDDWRKKEAREFRDAARAVGAIPLLAEQWERVSRMAEAVRDQLAEHEARGAFVGGLPERTVVWREDGVWCRCKPDWMPSDAREGMVVYDLKSTAASANPDNWGSRTLWGMGADFSAAFYTRGLRHVLGVHDIRYRFVVVENDEPHALSVVEIDPASLAVAERDVERAIELWRQCLSTGMWPGYTRRVAHVSMPAWEENRRLEREEREPMHANMVAAAMTWQAPTGEW